METKPKQGAKIKRVDTFYPPGIKERKLGSRQDWSEEYKKAAAKERIKLRNRYLKVWCYIFGPIILLALLCWSLGYLK